MHRTLVTKMFEVLADFSSKMAFILAQNTGTENIFFSVLGKNNSASHESQPESLYVKRILTCGRN